MVVVEVVVLVSSRFNGAQLVMVVLVTNSSITGSSVTRCRWRWRWWNTQTTGTGGAGGGGAGSQLELYRYLEQIQVEVVVVVEHKLGGAGGKGVVILSMPTAIIQELQQVLQQLQQEFQVKQY
jgi:hypothetical protein